MIQLSDEQRQAALAMVASMPCSNSDKSAELKRVLFRLGNPRPPHADNSPPAPKAPATKKPVVPLWSPAPIPQKKEANQMRKPINDLNSGRRAAAFQAAAQLPTASQRERETIAAIQRYPVIAAGGAKTDPETLKRMDAAFGTGARLPAITHTATRSTYRASGAA